MQGNHIYKGLSPFTVGKVLQLTHEVQGDKQSLPFCNVPCDLKGEIVALVPCELLCKIIEQMCQLHLTVNAEAL